MLYIVHRDRRATVQQITSRADVASPSQDSHAIANNAWNGPKITEIVPCMIGRKWPGLMNQDSWCIMTMAECGYADYQQSGAWMHCCMQTQAGGGGVMLWPLLSWDTLDPIIPIAQSLTALRYLNIVVDQVHPFMATVLLAGDGCYQQDNVPYHTARIDKEWFKEHEGEFSLMKSKSWFALHHQHPAMYGNWRTCCWHCGTRYPRRPITTSSNQCLDTWPLFFRLKEVLQVIR